MEARKVAAQFAAYVWFEATQWAEQSEEEKARFARETWRPFLPIAHEGLGRLLIKIAGGRSSRHRRRKQLCQTTRPGDEFGRRSGPLGNTQRRRLRPSGSGTKRQTRRSQVTEEDNAVDATRHRRLRDATRQQWYAH